MPLLFAGGGCAAGALAGLLGAGAVEAAGAAAGVGFAGGAAAGAGGAEEAAAGADLSDFEELFGVELLAPAAAGAAALVSAVSAFLDFEDFFVVAALVSAAGVAPEASAISPFFDLDDFLVLDASAVEPPLESAEGVALVDLADFVVELSAAVEESVVFAFLLFVDFLLPEAELSVVEVSSLAALFFFFLDLLVLLSLCPLDGAGWADCDDCDA